MTNKTEGSFFFAGLSAFCMLLLIYTPLASISLALVVLGLSTIGVWTGVQGARQQGGIVACLAPAVNLLIIIAFALLLFVAFGKAFV